MCAMQSAAGEQVSMHCSFAYSILELHVYTQFYKEILSAQRPRLAGGVCRRLGSDSASMTHEACDLVKTPLMSYFAI